MSLPPDCAGQFNNLIAVLDNRNYVKKTDDNYCFPNLFQDLCVENKIVNMGLNDSYAYASKQVDKLIPIIDANKEILLDFDNYILSSKWNQVGNNQLLYSGQPATFMITYNATITATASIGIAYLKIKKTNQDIQGSSTLDTFNSNSQTIGKSILVDVNTNDFIELRVACAFASGSITLDAVSYTPGSGGTVFNTCAYDICIHRVGTQ